MKTYYGSQKAMLDMISKESFPAELNMYLEPYKCSISKSDQWLPKGLDNPAEGELVNFLNPPMNDIICQELQNWWLAVPRNANTPNWDFISTCTIDNKPGLLLVEAKGHISELSDVGKPLAKDASDNSFQNDRQIDRAIQMANQNLDIEISKDHSYQLSNRIAHAWWLASKGIPTLLLYIGFKDCQYATGKNYEIFKFDSDWDSCFKEHLKGVNGLRLLNKWTSSGASEFMLSSVAVPTSKESRLREMNMAISEYASAYRRLDDLQLNENKKADVGAEKSFVFKDRIIPRGDQKTGAFGEFYVLEYLRREYPNKTIKLSENLSQKGYDIEVSSTECISVKAVSSYADKPKTSPIKREEDKDVTVAVHIIVLDKLFLPIDYWIIKDVNSFLGYKENVKRTQTSLTVSEGNMKRLKQSFPKLIINNWENFGKYFDVNNNTFLTYRHA